MGIELAKAFVRIRGDASGLRRDLQDVKRQTEKTLQGIAVTAAGVLSIVSFATIGVLKRALGLAGQFEQTTVSFETLLGNTELAREKLEELQQFAIKTPFTLPGVEDAARSLLAVGFEADDLIPTLKSLGDIAAGLGRGEEGLRRMVLNLGQVRAQGKLTGRELRDFAVLGVPLMEELAKMFGVTEEAIIQMTQASDISNEAVTRAFRQMTDEGGRFANLMDKQAQTLTGSFLNLQDAVIKLLREFGVSLLPVGKSVVQMLTKMTATISGTVEGFGLIVAGALAGAAAFSTLGAVILAARVAMIAFGITWKAVLIGGGLGIAIVVLGAALGAYVGWINSANEELDKFDDKTEKVVESVNKLTKGIDQASKSVKRFTEEFKKFLGDTTGIIELIKDFVDELEDFGQARIEAPSLPEEDIKFLKSIGFPVGKELLVEIDKEKVKLMDEFLLNFADKMKELEKFDKGVADPVVALRKELEKLEGIKASQSLKDVVESIIGKQIGKLTGITEAISDANRELDLLQGKTTKIDQVVAGFAAKGALEKDLNRLGKVLKRVEVTEQRKKVEENEKERLSNLAKSIFEKTRTPLERMRKELEQLEMLRTKGLIDPETFRRAVLEFGSEVKKEAPKALLSGGRFGFAQMGASLQDALLNQAKENLEKERNKLLNKNLVKQDEIIKAIKEGNEKVLKLT